ncbi:MAG: cell division protein FtsA, partial [Christensenellales bacterium]
MKTQIAAIDFGTSKVVTVVAQSGGFSRLDIIGSGTVPYAGFSDGDWNEPERLIETVRDSISAAELEAKMKIREVYVGVPGEYVHVATGEAEIEIGGEITENEINAVQDLVADKLRIGEKGGYVLHRSPAWFSIDDGKKTMEPMGSAGSRLRARVSFMVADPVFIDDAAELMGALGITVQGFLSSALGGALQLLTLEDRDRVAMLIDIGYLSAEISVVEGDAIVYHAMLAGGGGHMTAALSEGLKILMHEAEQVKRAYLFNPDEFDQDDYYEAFDDDGARLAFPRNAVARYIESSMDELCELIDKTLKNDAAQYFGPRSQIYLTGGGISLMRGGREYLAAKIGRPVKAPPIKSAKLNSPVYASALGLVSLIFDSIEQQAGAEPGL